MIHINLLPIKQLQAEVTRRREIIIGSVVLAGALLLLLGTHLYQSYQLTQSENELAGLRTELQALNAKVKEVADLQVKIKDLRGKQKIIEDLNNKKSGPVLVMASLSLATPASLWLTDLREGGGNVTMNGLAADHETVANFMRSLATSKHFTNVELIETTQGAGPTAALKKFAIRARVVYRAPSGQPAGAKTKAPAPAQKEEKKS
ncbi:MAG: PilN domain-containing protein [Candidatus Binatia bacterium]